MLKLPKDEQKTHEHYKDGLHYQASMFESSYGDGYYEGNKKGKAEGKIEATEQMILNMAKQGLAIKTIADITGLAIEGIKLILERVAKMINRI